MLRQIIPQLLLIQNSFAARLNRMHDVILGQLSRLADSFFERLLGRNVPNARFPAFLVTKPD